MSKTDNLTDFLTDVADAIREKKGTTDLINPQDFSSEIKSIQSSSSPKKVIYTGPLCIGNFDNGATDISDPDNEGRRTTNLTVAKEHSASGPIYKCHASDWNPYTSEKFEGAVDYRVTINLNEAIIPTNKGNIVLTMESDSIYANLMQGDSVLTANISLIAYELM